VINGEKQGLAPEPGSYARVERKWKQGDVVELTLPMKLSQKNLGKE
jgi:DUF1680 family protein